MNQVGPGAPNRHLEHLTLEGLLKHSRISNPKDMEAPKVKSYSCRRTVAPFLLVLLLAPGQLGLAGSAEKPPTIGLVLGGGGARGFAHLGILEWFHENQIPVDYIAGTSMGGLVGGLYATGMHPCKMRELIREQNWRSLLGANAKFQDLSLRRKEDRRAFPNSIEFGWKNGLSGSDALVSSHSIGLLIDRLTRPYSSLDSFDDLPIPFRCTAVDLLSGKRRLLKRGSLSRALRATMAVPGVFPPVEYNDQLLVDGGVLDNLPTGAAQEMGADIIIAVDVSSPLKGREELTSALSIFDQAVSVMILENTLVSRRDADLIIVPDLDSFTATDFEKAEAIANQGKDAAERKANCLRSLSLGPSEWRQHLVSRGAHSQEDEFKPNDIQVRGTRATALAKIEKRLQKHRDRALEPRQLEAQLNEIHGLGRWAHLGYRVQQKGGQDTLSIDVQEKRHGPPFINLALVANNSEADSVQFNLQSRLTFFDMGTFGSEWRVDASLGSRPWFATEYYRPFSSGFFFAPRLFAGRDLTNLYQNGQRQAEYRTRFAGAGFDVGHDLGSR